MGHIRLSREADLVVVAPATAHLLARMAQGLADDLATTLLLATDKRALLAPAMNVAHVAASGDAAQCRDAARRRRALRRAGGGRDGLRRIRPRPHERAAGDRRGDRGGAARIALPLPAAQGRSPGGMCSSPRGRRASRSIRRAIISNRSSGKQGHAIAAAAARAGARVTLVSGPVEIADPPGVETRHVETAQRDARGRRGARCRPISSSAPRPSPIGASSPPPDKIKKRAGGAPPTLVLRENPDILASVARRARRPPGARRRLRGRDARRDRQCAGKARAQGLRPHRRQ